MIGKQRTDDFAYRDVFEDEGHRIEIRACHSRTPRLPRGHEYARQITRGRGIEMVEVVELSWSVALNGRPLGRLRQNPSGSYGQRGDKDLRTAALRLVPAMKETP